MGGKENLALEQGSSTLRPTADAVSTALPVGRVSASLLARGPASHSSRICGEPAVNQEPGLEPKVLCRQHVLKRDRHVTLGL